MAGTDRPDAGAIGDRARASRVLDETELDSALQLLVERAQYITGATGTALALPQGEEMVCRASAGSCAPAVGAGLQVRSGLTGESIARRQLLRCDNAETDPRVNLEACRTLGIASIVVLPLLRRTGEVRGLFELFSDHPYAFEERDLIALERMAALTSSALDLAEQRPSSGAAHQQDAQKAVASDMATSAPRVAAAPVNIALDPSSNPAPDLAIKLELAAPTALPTEESATSPALPVTESELVSAPFLVPEAMLRVRKCASCGFPVSEARTLCLDCEKKQAEKKAAEEKQREQNRRAGEQRAIEAQIERHEPKLDGGRQDAASDAAELASQEEFIPAFLANSQPVQESWLANHVNLLAVLVLIVGILLAIVVFR